MNEATAQTVSLTANQALNTIETLLPFLEAAIPAVGAAAGPIGLGVSAAAALVPLILELVKSGAITVERQNELLAKVATVMASGFTGPQWKLSTAPA